MRKIGAYVKYNFDKGFLLDEEKLRKIHDIITTRVKENIEYHIYRNDSFSFKTTDIEDIFKEENSKWTKFNEIKMNINSNDFNFSLNFDEKTVNLSIDGEDRDKVFLLYSELKDYISNDVCTQRIIIKDTTDFFFTFILFVPVALIALLIFSTRLQTSQEIDPDIITNVIKSDDIHEKMNFLIQLQIKKNNEEEIFSYVAVIYLAILIIPILFRNQTVKLFIYIFPTNIFLFGKEIDNYNKKKELKNKIFWGIIIALMVSIVGGYILLKI